LLFLEGSPSDRDQIHQKLSDQVSSIDVIRLDQNLHRSVVDLEHQFVQSQAPGIELLGFDEWMTIPRAKELNFRRESFVQSLCHPLMIWMSEQTRGMLMFHAPDFVDYRTASLNFNEVSEPPTVTMGDLPPDPPQTFSSDPSLLAEKPARNPRCVGSSSDFPSKARAAPS
jgi:hypothetical protein